MEKHITIGQVLRQARQAKNVSLEDVANKTKININLLRSLEQDHLKNLPNKTYVRGFVKNCAKILGVGAQEALDALDRTYKKLEPGPEDSTAQEEEVSSAPSPTRTQKSRPAPKASDIEKAEMQHRLQGIAGQLFNKKIIASAIALVVLTLIVNGIINFFSNIESEKESLSQAKADPIKPKDSSLFEMDAAKKIAQIENEDQADSEKLEDSPTTETDESNAESNSDEKEAKKEIKEEPKNEVKKEIKKEPKKEAKEEEKKEVKEEPKVTVPAGKFPYKDFYQAPRNLFALNGEASELENEAIVPKRMREAMKSDGHNLFINALDGDTWISYQVDGGDIKRYVLKKGKTLLLQAEETILIFFGNLNIAKIFYNDQLVDAKSRSGVKSLIFPEEKSTDFELPLFPSYKGVPHKQDHYKANMMEKDD